MKEQPFYIGQKVVCISSNVSVKCGQYYTVAGNYFCLNCSTWHTFVKEFPGSGFWCCECDFKDIGGLPLFASAHSSRFAPVQESFQAITFEKVMEQELSSVN